MAKNQCITEKSWGGLTSNVEATSIFSFITMVTALLTGVIVCWNIIGINLEVTEMRKQISPQWPESRSRVSLTSSLDSVTTSLKRLEDTTCYIDKPYGWTIGDPMNSWGTTLYKGKRTITKECCKCEVCGEAKAR